MVKNKIINYIKCSVIFKQNCPVILTEIKCLKDEFQCGNGRCVSGDVVCDGFFDCIDMSDEEGCGNIMSYTVTCDK